jgi:ABC-type sugar transport system ATPase subunit
MVLDVDCKMQEMKKEGLSDLDRLQLLHEVTGAFRPGVLTALVGVSGAGKTTLMDVLAGRKTGGYIEGDIRISGYPKKQETFARISGYCEQNDIHSPNVTVKESLIYSAWLRLPKDVDERTRMVNESRMLATPSYVYPKPRKTLEFFFCLLELSSESEPFSICFFPVYGLFRCLWRMSWIS